VLDCHRHDVGLTKSQDVLLKCDHDSILRPASDQSSLRPGVI
jgi:hypothetical protein